MAETWEHIKAGAAKRWKKVVKDTTPAKKKSAAKKMGAWNFKSAKERKEYHKENPYAASHPYAKGAKLKPKGAPAPYKPL